MYGSAPDWRVPAAWKLRTMRTVRTLESILEGFLAAHVVLDARPWRPDWVPSFAGAEIADGAIVEVGAHFAQLHHQLRNGVDRHPSHAGGGSHRATLHEGRDDLNTLGKGKQFHTDHYT